MTLLSVLPVLGQPASLVVNPDQPQQVIEGMGCGLIFFEGHVTSLGEKGKTEMQGRLYDAMFKDVHTDFTNLMIRHDHEPANDNANPYLPNFNSANFAYADRTLTICKAALERNPKMRFIATLYTPPPWMKTNNDISGGGKDRASIKPGMELELAEYCWGFLAYMSKMGVPVEFISISNEPDWPHDQPGYCLTMNQHADLVSKVADYFDEMARRFPAVPRARIVGPNTLSAVNCLKWLRAADTRDPGSIDIVGTHDYDRRGERFKSLLSPAGKRPVWVTEWCVNGPDNSPGLLRSATEYWLAMSEAFNQGVTAWMAYDWVYPPREGGEALIHVEWGRNFQRTKIYHGFRQWCMPLVPGMRVVACELSGKDVSSISKPGIKAAAFTTVDAKRLVVHVANVQDHETELSVNPGTRFSQATISHIRTSASEDCVVLTPPSAMEMKSVTLPARSMNTWIFEIR